MDHGNLCYNSGNESTLSGSPRHCQGGLTMICVFYGDLDFEGAGTLTLSVQIHCGLVQIMVGDAGKRLSINEIP